MASYDKDAAAEAISSIESDGDYGALGPSTNSGDRAYGKYQVMGSNIPQWTKAATGTALTPQQFLQDKDAQDATFHHQFGSYVDKYGSPEDAASAWFTGGPRSTGANRSDVLGTTGSQYVNKFSKAYKGALGSNMATADDEEDTPPNSAPTNGILSSAPASGALTQSPNGKGDWLSNIGDTLMNMAPGLASISSPAQAQALATLAAASKKTGGTWSTSGVDPKTGVAVQTNSLTGQTRNIQVHAPQEVDRKWGIIGKDKYGQPTYGYSPSVEDYDAGKTAAPAAGAAADDSSAVSLTGQPFLDQIAKDKGTGYQSQVQSIIDGRTPYPTGMLLKTPFGQQLAQDVTQADPSFETGNAMSRVKVRNEFKSGGVSSPAGQILAGNTALKHAGEMSDALEQFKGGDQDHSGIPFVSYYQNKLHNAAIQGTGTPESQSYGDFMTAKNHFSEEVTKFYSGTAGADAERKRALANLDEAKSLPELRSAIKEESQLMRDKVNGLQDRWRTGMGPLVKDFPLINDESQSAIDRIGKRYETSSAPAATKPSTGTFKDVPWSFK